VFKHKNSTLVQKNQKVLQNFLTFLEKSGKAKHGNWVKTKGYIFKYFTFRKIQFFEG